MITQELVDYIKQALASGAQEGMIADTLGQQGWTEADIAGGLQQARGGNQKINFVPNPSGNAGIGADTVRYAGFWVRLAAYIVDGIIVSVAIGLFVSLTSVLFKGSVAAMLVVVLLELIIVWGYFIFMTHKYQATFGKKLVGICIFDEGGNTASLGKIILRETIGKIVSSAILNIGFIMAGFTQKKQGLHDMMANTIVIYKDPNKKTSKWVYVVLIMPIIITLAILFGIILVSMNSARQKALDSKAKQEQILKNYQQMQNDKPAVTDPSASSVPVSAPVSSNSYSTPVNPISYSNSNVMDYSACKARGGRDASPFQECDGVSLGLIEGFYVDGKQNFCCSK